MSLFFFCFCFFVCFFFWGGGGGGGGGGLGGCLFVCFFLYFLFFVFNKTHLSPALFGGYQIAVHFIDQLHFENKLIILITKRICLKRHQFFSFIFL